MRTLCSHHCFHVRQMETEAQKGQVTSQSWGLNPLLPLCLGSFCSSVSERSSSKQSGQKPSPHITWVWPWALCGGSAVGTSPWVGGAGGGGARLWEGRFQAWPPSPAGEELGTLGWAWCCWGATAPSFTRPHSLAAPHGACSWQGNVCLVGQCGPGRIAREHVLGTGVGSASSQLGIPKQVTSPFWLSFWKPKMGVTDVCFG